MAILPICRVGEPVLRQKAKPVQKLTKRVEKLIDDMVETMYEADGVGLAAPQVGVSERIIVIDVGEGLLALINPEIVHAEGQAVDVEGCLSIPDVRGYVERAAQVTVQGLNPKGRAVRVDADGWLARALQHEIDHLDGILIIDKMTPVAVKGER